LRAEAAARGRTLRRHAVAWVLEQPGVTAAIVGPRTQTEGAELALLAAD
jgi:aryl-alcohol dehydrogenase-like predicted oxidoreductase